VAKKNNPALQSNLNLIEAALKQEVALDIETLGLAKGSSIVELSIFDPNTNTVNQFRIAPNLTVTEASIKMQDVSNLRTSSSDVLIEHPALSRMREMEIEAKLKGQQAPKKIGKLDTVVLQTLLDDTLTGGTFEKDIKAKAGVSNLSIKSFAEMSDDELKRTVSAIQDIGEGALKTQAGADYFEKGVKEGSQFLARAYKEGGVGEILREEFVQGRVREASSKTPKTDQIGALRANLAKYSKNRNLILKVHDATAYEMLGKVQGLIKNKSVQIANAMFESKQIGALVAVAEQDIRRDLIAGRITKAEAASKSMQVSGIRTTLAETPVGVSDIMPISGKDVNQARMRAQITGDYSGLFRPMIEEMASGKHARVTDILDIVRSQSSFEQKLGIASRRTPNMLSVDVAQRLYGFAEAVGSGQGKKAQSKALLKKELHEGSYDVLSQSKVTRSTLMQTEALAEVANRTERGISLIQQAKKQEGSLYKAVVLAQVKKEAMPFMEEANIATRLSRAAENIVDKGFSPETSGTFKTGKERIRMTADGNLMKVASAMPGERLRLESLDDVLAHIKSRPNYAHADMMKGVNLFMKSINEGRQGGPIISFDQEAQKFQMTSDFNNLSKSDFKAAEAIKRDYLQDGFVELNKKMKAGKVAGLSPESIQSYVAGIEKSYLSKNSFIARHGNWKHIDFKAGKTAGVMVAAMGAVGMLGAIGNMLGGVRHQRGGPETLRTMNYERWFEANAQYHGLEEYDKRGNAGFSERGMGAVQRKQKTDFGSPYQGPGYSQYVMEQQALLRERKMYEMQAFAHTHFSNEGAVGNLLNSVMAAKDPQYSINSFLNSLAVTSRMIAPGSTFASRGQYVSGSDYAGMSDQQLFKVDLSKYKVSASDADTIVLQSKSANPKMAGFFGMNNKDSISIRLAGIDAPEMQHVGKEGQPLAERALGRLRAMMQSGKKMELLIDPNNITYGRQVGSLFIDGKNVQLDLIKSGDVKFLNFQRGGGNQFNPQIYGRMSKVAEKNRAGIYSHPFFEPMIEFEKRSKQSITFNTMVNIEKVSQNAGLMSLYSIMHAADKNGFVTPHMASEAQRIAEGTTTLAGDYKTPIVFGKGTAPHKSYIDNLAYDNSMLMKGRESGTINKVSRKNGYGNLDKKLSIDSTRSSTSVYNKRRYEVFDRYNVDRTMKLRRQMTMQEMQKSGLRQLNQSPIGHHRM
jgi:endonuclease YncB( thermonuclease family)